MLHSLLPWLHRLFTRYLVHLDGHSYSPRLIKLLATNSLILKEEMPRILHWWAQVGGHSKNKMA